MDGPYETDSFTISSATSSQFRQDKQSWNAYVNAARDFSWTVPVTLKVGAAINSIETEDQSPAKTWAFPPDLVRVLASHHGGDNDPADRQVLAALRIADALAEEVGYGFHAEIPEGQLKKAVQVLGLDLIRLEKLRDTAKELAEAFSH
jgi:hypothetical protein